eukprot:421257-Rhodomonas_salina.1
MARLCGCAGKSLWSRTPQPLFRATPSASTTLKMRSTPPFPSRQATLSIKSNNLVNHVDRSFDVKTLVSRLTS